MPIEESITSLLSGVERRLAAGRRRVRDGDMLVAQCLEYDICTQAKDLDELQSRMDGLIELERRETRVETGQDFGGIPPAPENFHNMWGHAKIFAKNDSPYEMALAA